MRTRSCLAFATVLLLDLAFQGQVAHAVDKPKESDVIRKVQQFYESVVDLKGKFKQVYTDALYDRKRTSYGYVYVKKPGMMRWNYVAPESKFFIADGKELWVYEPKDKQAFRNPLNTDTLSTGLTFLLGKGDLQKEFNVGYDPHLKLGGPDDLVLKLTPKQSTAHYKYIVLVVKPNNFSVGESMVVSLHATNHFIFTELEPNTRLPRTRFQFKPPADVRVMDASKLKR